MGHSPNPVLTYVSDDPCLPAITMTTMNTKNSKNVSKRASGIGSGNNDALCIARLVSGT